MFQDRTRASDGLTERCNSYQGLPQTSSPPPRVVERLALPATKPRLSHSGVATCAEVWASFRGIGISRLGAAGTVDAKLSVRCRRARARVRVRARARARAAARVAKDVGFPSRVDGDLRRAGMVNLKFARQAGGALRIATRAFPPRTPCARGCAGVSCSTWRSPILGATQRRVCQNQLDQRSTPNASI